MAKASAATTSTAREPEPGRNRQIGGHAVVLGASMAGLLAARVLADSYAQVTVIEGNLAVLDAAGSEM